MLETFVNMNLMVKKDSRPGNLKKTKTKKTTTTTVNQSTIARWATLSNILPTHMKTNCHRIHHMLSKFIHVLEPQIQL
jgi:hypothetical protein